MVIYVIVLQINATFKLRLKISFQDEISRTDGRMWHLLAFKYAY